MQLRAIGRIRTPYRRIEDCPGNSDGATGSTTIELDPVYAAGLHDIEAASHLIVLYWLGEADRSRLQSVTRVDGEVRGVFANRSPHRPNPVGIAAVRFYRREGFTLAVGGMDCLDGTPLIDLKPYLARIDSIPGASVVWQR